ncbi:acyl-CoA synthetase (AMP-forming)/AMP-acid ligase II [Nocardia tenerifensis]|uniref:Acyl-CoA synthetase (AMP-forming)/AMP-acid ligase II n=1 Tax=Nocardia tenerifensis TaxID=228006 RepID=A0A318KEJ5_9NOCA|nr:fatty acyl-AMP ligase [Nocardia tenerifensis]PXX71229.1 acyl-CoA synthetase (AMP-forming)/AMP-acid ligase II [Nocardia tenerifensis]
MTTYFPVEPANLAQMLTARAAATPEPVRFYHLGDGDEPTATMTFPELDRAARATAAHLARVTRPGERALLLYAPGLEFVVAYYGCLYAGVIAVPVAPPQPNKLADSLARLASIVRNSGAELLLTSADIEPLLTPVLAEAEGFAQVRTVVTDRIEAAEADDYRDPGLTGDTIAHLQYSSGSTGEPKGVALTHGNVLANLRLVTGKIGHGVGVAWLPTFHDMGLLSMVTYPVYSDSTVISMSPLAFVQRPARWIAAMSRYKATHTVAPNFSFALAVRRVPRDQVERYDLSALRVALCGAEPVRVDTMDTFAEHFGAAGFDAHSLFPCYGLAEATLLVTGGPAGSGLTTVEVDPTALAKGRVEPVAGGRRLVASGELNDAYELVLTDPDTHTPLPDGQVGEICLRGDSIGLGYWDAPEATADTFAATVAGRTGHFLRTGDLGFVHENQLYVTGRRKDLIIVDGYNHYPSDLEASAMAAHPALRPDRCVAFQVLDGETPALVLVAELDRGQTPDDADKLEIIAAVRRAVGEHNGLRLDDVVLVTAGSIPLTSSGKVRRFIVRDQYRDGALTPLP